MSFFFCCVCSFPGVQRPIDEYGSGAPAPASAATNGDAGGDDDDDDDDFDLFGDDDEEAVSAGLDSS